MIRKTFLQISSLVALHTTWLTAADTKLTLLHINDHHSHLTEASAGYVNIYGADIPASVRANNGGTNEIRAYYGGYPRLVTAFQELEVAARHSGRDVLKLHAGDAITGTTYFTLFEGAADAKLMTHVCFDAFTLGNHEFDKGDTGLARFLRAISNETEASSTCAVRPAILGANIVPRIGSPIFGEDVPAIEHSRVFNLSNGEKVGVIGITIARKTMESSQPDPGTILLDERETAQAEIAALTAIGVNKIVLLTHIGYPNDQQWIAQLPGVDVVIGGDSHSLLGDEETRIMSGFAPLGDYATIIEKPDGTKTCVVQAWDYAKLIGNLNIDFDGDGNVIACHGSPIFPLNPDKVTVRDANPRYDLSAADAAEVMQSLTTRTAGQALEFMENVDAASDLAFYTAKVNELANTVVTTVPARISLEAGGYESGACDLVAQGFLLNPLSSADIAIQNRGGCRSSIEEVGSQVQVLCVYCHCITACFLHNCIFVSDLYHLYLCTGNIHCQ
jgi:5''-nucleotidase/2'',3''-cyclic phosphodiesterase and related esterases